MHETLSLIHILFIIAAAVFIVPFFQRIGLGSVLGYLAAGAIIGPWGLGAVSQIDEVRHIAEFGVVFLLFIIGIELNFTRLIAMKRSVLGLGASQVILTSIIFTAIALLFGISKESAIIIGFGLALSSTAFGLQILTEKNELKTKAGQASFSILLLQDLAVVPLLTIVSFLAHDKTEIENIGFAFLETIFVIIGVILAGRFLLTPALRIVAKSNNSELFMAAAVLVVLGTAWLMEEVGLSMALGAFLAGLMLADSHYRHQVITDIQPFRGILLGLFFMSVGMSVDFGLLLQKPLIIATLVTGLLIIKSLVIFTICKIAKIDNGTSLKVSTLLSQSGEFGFVIFGLAFAVSLIEAELFQLLTLIIAVSMVTTPFMNMIGELLEKKIKNNQINNNNGINNYDDDIAKPDCNEPFIIIAGFGRVGRRVAKILDSADVNYIALDNDPDLVTRERKNGYCVIFGNTARFDVLNSVGASKASAFIITIDKPITTERLVHIIRDKYPNTPIYVRGRNKEHCESLYKAGATMPVSENLEASIQLASAALEAVDVSEDNIDALLDNFRKNYYSGIS